MVLDKLVYEAFFAQKMRAGSPNLVLDLRDQGHAYDRKTVAASMKRHNLRAKAARKYKATTNSRHNLAVAPNLLGQNFSVGAPNQKWGSDKSYLWTDEGWPIWPWLSTCFHGWLLAGRLRSA